MDISASLKGIFLEGCPLSWKEGEISQLYVNVHVFYIEYFSILLKIYLKNSTIKG